MIIACATDNGKTFIERHFGDANHYVIYELIGEKFIMIDSIVNTTGEEKQHADPIKAKGILDLLLEKNVQVGITKVFGPNIKKIKKHIVPVLISENDIEAGLMKVLENIAIINEQIILNDDRNHVDLREENMDAV